MSELMKLEELLFKGRISRRQFLSRLSILGVPELQMPRPIIHTYEPSKL